jgi:acyl carrier protein
MEEQMSETELARDSRVDLVSSRIAHFIVDDLQWEGTVDQLLGVSPVELPGVLDSADLLELAGFLEDEFDVVIEDEEIVAENFATLRKLGELVVAKQDQASS